MSLTVEDLFELVEKITRQDKTMPPLARKFIIVHRNHRRMLRRFKKRYTAKRSWQRGAR